MILVHTHPDAILSHDSQWAVKMKAVNASIHEFKGESAYYVYTVPQGQHGLQI